MTASAMVRLFLRQRAIERMRDPSANRHTINICALGAMLPVANGNQEVRTLVRLMHEQANQTYWYG